MTLQVWFWIFMVLWFILDFWSGYVAGQPYPIRFWGRGLVLFIVLVILGWQVFGSPVK